VGGPIRTEALVKTRVGTLVVCFANHPVVLAAMPALADGPVPPQPRTRHLFAVGLGPVYWSELHDQDPSTSPFAADLGRFHTWGFSLEFAYHYRAARWGGVDVMFGADMGFLSNENSQEIGYIVLPFGETFSGDLVSNVFFLTPGARFVIASTDRWRFNVGFGAGFYLAEFVEEWSYYYDYDDNELWDETAFGGYISIGGDYRIWNNRPRWRMRFEYKTHFADFGDTAPFAPGSGDLTGPIQNLFIGFVWQI
jgi:hypothetical protein